MTGIQKDTFDYAKGPFFGHFLATKLTFCFPCFAALCFHIVSRLELGGPFLLHTCYFYLILVAIHVSDDLQNQFFILIRTDICCFMLFMYVCSCSGMACVETYSA